jgi:hypothetical protein
MDMPRSIKDVAPKRTETLGTLGDNTTAKVRELRNESKILDILVPLKLTAQGMTSGGYPYRGIFIFNEFVIKDVLRIINRLPSFDTTRTA